GYDEGGQLTERVRRRPYSVVLFDEIEKAHPEAFNILLQILDDGRLTDSKGRTVNFKNTIIILTSNVGSEVIHKYSIGFGSDSSEKTEADRSYDEMRSRIQEVIRSEFKPEFLNRLDEIIVFHHLTAEHLRRIVDYQLDSVAKRLSNREIKITVSEKAKDYFAKKGFDPVYGARPLKRLLQHEILDLLAKRLIDGSVKAGDEVMVDAKKDKIEVEVKG
ncbi:MAG: AAA family ATPase, partial [Parcubacteria group bacterium]|nr:AAA family ATPase [Parcubacteria group bacterium]